MGRANPTAVSGASQHVGGPLAGTQGTAVVSQATLQQPTQQPQPLPAMGMPLTQPGKQKLSILKLFFEEN